MESQQPLFTRLQQSHWLVRFFLYLFPVATLLAIPLLVGKFSTRGQETTVGGVSLFWFGVWLEVVWGTLWAARFTAMLIPVAMWCLSGFFTRKSQEAWKGLGQRMEMAVTCVLWCTALIISSPTIKNHHIGNAVGTEPWEAGFRKVVISVLVSAILNVVQKVFVGVVVMRYSQRTTRDRVEINNFQIDVLTKLYAYSLKSSLEIDADIAAILSGTPVWKRAPATMAAVCGRFGNVAGAVAADFTSKELREGNNHLRDIVVALLDSADGSKALARRLFRTLVRPEAASISLDDLKRVIEKDDEALAAFAWLDSDGNGDVTMEDLNDDCSNISKDRKAVSQVLVDVDSVTRELDSSLFIVVVLVAVLAATSLLFDLGWEVILSVPATFLGLSWLFKDTIQEYFNAIIFVFIKHPFDVEDRITVKTAGGTKLDDYFVQRVSLLYSELRQLDGTIVQMSNSFLSTCIISNMKRSGPIAEAVTLVVKFGTHLQQINKLREILLEFVKKEGREFKPVILVEIRDITEMYSLSLNVVCFHKSNFQDELRRIKRRNKFICALQQGILAVGMQGPRVKTAGWRPENPFHLAIPERDEMVVVANTRTPSDTDQQSTVQSRAPVDQSLGASGTSSADLYGGPPQPPRVSDTTRQVSAERPPSGRRKRLTAKILSWRRSRRRVAVSVAVEEGAA